MQDTCIGQIGVGRVGRHFATRLLEAMGGLVVHDLDRERLRSLERQGARVAELAMALGNEADVILLSLPSPDAVESVVLGPDGLLASAREGALVIDTSTIDPFTVRRLYEAAADRGVAYLEAPLTGAASDSPGTEAARLGTFTVLAGGDQAAFVRAKPVLDVLGDRIYHLGPAGSGSVMKLVSNQIAAAVSLATAEGLALAAAAGFELETSLEVLCHSVARSYVLDERIRPLVLRKDIEPDFTVDLAHKDLRLAGELGQQLKVPLLFNPLVQASYQAMRARGQGQRDTVDAVKFVAEVAGVDLYDPPPRPFD